MGVKRVNPKNKCTLNSLREPRGTATWNTGRELTRAIQRSASVRCCRAVALWRCRAVALSRCGLLVPRCRAVGARSALSRWICSFRAVALWVARSALSRCGLPVPRCRAVDCPVCTVFTIASAEQSCLKYTLASACSCSSRAVALWVARSTLSRCGCSFRAVALWTALFALYSPLLLLNRVA